MWPNSSKREQQMEIFVPGGSSKIPQLLVLLRARCLEQAFKTTNKLIEEKDPVARCVEEIIRGPLRADRHETKRRNKHAISTFSRGQDVYLHPRRQ